MPTWLKVVLGILVGFIVICSGVTGACYLYGKSKVEEFQGGAAAAEEFGKTHNKLECVDEAINKSKNCGKADFMCLTNVQVFYQSCQKHAAPTDKLCEGYDSAKGDDWVAAKCTAYGMTGDDRCKAVVGQAAMHCVTSGSGSDTEETMPESPPMPEEAAPE